MSAKRKTAEPPKPPATVQSPPYTALGKDHLVAMKAQYLDDLKPTTLNPTVRMAIQQELALINAALKAINIEQSKADFEAAQRRRAAGTAEQLANTARAIAKTGSAPRPAPVPAPAAAPPAPRSAPVAPPTLATARPRGPWPKGIESMGEFVLMRAGQLRSALRKIRGPLAEHTSAFLPHLEAFLAGQEDLVQHEHDEVTAATKRTAPAEWAETWSESQASPSD